MSERYEIVVIEITLKTPIKKTNIPSEFKKEICKSVNKLFPNWKTISYDFKDVKN